MCKNYEKKWESNETKLERDKKSGNEEFEIIQDRADAPCTSTPEHLEIVVARQPTWMWREREREKLRTRNLEDRGNIVSKGLSCPRSFKLQYSLAGIAVSETTSKQTRMNLNDSFLQYAKSVLSIPRIEENFTPFLQEEEESSKTKEKEKKILASWRFRLARLKEALQALDCQLSPGRWRNFRRGNSREGGSRCIGTERYTGEKDVLGAPRAGSSVQIFYMGGWHNGQVSGLALRTFCRSFHKEGRTPPPPFVNREGFTTRLTFLLEYASTQSIRSNPSVTLDNVWNRCLKRG